MPKGGDSAVAVNRRCCCCHAPLLLSVLLSRLLASVLVQRDHTEMPWKYHSHVFCVQTARASTLLRAHMHIQTHLSTLFLQQGALACQATLPAQVKPVKSRRFTFIQGPPTCIFAVLCHGHPALQNAEYAMRF